MDDKNEQKIQQLFPNYKLGTGLRVDSIIVLPSKYRREVSHSLIEYAKGYAEENDKNCFYGAVHPDDRAVKVSLSMHLTEFDITEEIFPVRLYGGKFVGSRIFCGKWTV